MADPDFKGLNRLSSIQSSRFGTSSSLRPNAVQGMAGAQYRRQQEDYNGAMRLLRRQARRGDAGSALDAIKLREQAIESSVAPGGIRRKEEFDAATAGNVASRAGAAAANERGKMLDRAYTEATRPALPPTAGMTKLDEIEGSQPFKDARDLGVEDPTSVMPRDQRLGYRKTLDAALGEARSPEEVAALKERGGRFGVPAKAFDRRAEWWNRNR